MTKRFKAILPALLLAACPIPLLAHGEPNWKVVAWEKRQTNPEGLRSGWLVDINSITRAGDLVSYREEWKFIDDKNRPVQQINPQPPDYKMVWDPIPLNEQTKLTGALRVNNCKTMEHLVGTTIKDADGKIKVKALSIWAPIPAGGFRVVHEFVCSQS